MKTGRAYSILNVKAIDEDEDNYLISGIATTPTPDRMGDVVEPMGAKFALPMPLLWQHQHDAPVGRVEFAKPQKNGIPYKATLPKIKEAGRLRDRVEEAVQSIRYRLVTAVSIGFRAMRDSMEYIEDTGGIRFKEWEWLELSLVTIPANAEATIKSIKSLDSKLLAASGHKQSTVAWLDFPAGVTAKNIRNITSGPEGNSMNIAEQIKAFEAKRAASAERMAALMEKSAEEGRTLDAAEEEEYDTLATEVKSVDAHLVRLRSLEGANVAKAQRITVKAGESAEGAAAARIPHIVQVDKPLPPGIEFARYAMCLGSAKGQLEVAHNIAKTRFADTPRVVNTLKAAVAAGTTTDSTWAAPLVEYNQFAGDFVEFLRPQTIIGRFGQGGVPSLRAVPFNVNIRAQTSGGEGYWVGQGAPKPITKFDFENIYLPWAKVANIAVITEELLRFSNPSAELLVRDSLAAALIARLDIDFVDQGKVAVANVSPASITSDVVAIPATGTGTAADIRTDVKALMGAYITANITPTTGVWIMSASTALALSLMMNALGQREFPDVTMLGGTFMGLPVITSEHVVSGTSGSIVILANASDIWLSDDGQVVLDASREASLQMLDNPTNNSTGSTTATSMVSMFQTNSVAIRAERWINWKKRRSAAVQVLDNVSWGT